VENWKKQKNWKWRVQAERRARVCEPLAPDNLACLAAATYVVTFCVVLCAVTLPEHTCRQVSPQGIVSHERFGLTLGRTSVLRRLRPLASLAVIVGLRICKQGVAGSIPVTSTI